MRPGPPDTLRMPGEGLGPGAFMPHIVEEAMADDLEPAGGSVPAPES